MLKTAKTQKLPSTKIYDLLVGLGADKKGAELAIGEFIKDIPKILASKTKETDLDFTVPSSKEKYKKISKKAKKLFGIAELEVRHKSCP